MTNTQQLHISTDARIQVLRNMGFELRIRRSESGDRLLSNLFNLTQLLRHHPIFRGRARYDDFAESMTWTGDGGDHERVTDHHMDLIRYECEDRWGVAFSQDKAWSAFEIVAKENRSNPLLDHLNSLRGSWDGTNRAAGLLSNYLGAEDIPINRAYSMRWLLSIVARAHATINNPVKVDTTLVLYGGQGIGKSTALETICFSSDFGSRYFGDSEINMDNYKEAVQSIQGKLLYEIQELAKRSSSQETEKAFLSRKIDDVRLPYRRSNEQFARRTVFCATTNKKNVLHDATGSRRFWCVDLGNSKIDIGMLRGDLSQIWSEVLHYYDRGEQHYLTDYEETLRIESAQDFTDPHPLTDAVLDIAKRIPSPCTVAQIIERLYESSDPTKDNTKHLDKSTRQNQAIISDILQSNGFIYARRSSSSDSSIRLRGWWKG